MAPLAARLQEDLNAARKSQDKPLVLLLGTMLADIRNREIELKRDLTDDDVTEVLRRGIKKRREGGRVSLSEVIIHDDENFERALKRFKKKCEKAGILSDLRKHRHYEKPSERRKRKLNAAIRKNRRTRHG